MLEREEMLGDGGWVGKGAKEGGGDRWKEAQGSVGCTRCTPVVLQKPARTRARTQGIIIDTFAEPTAAKELVGRDITGAAIRRPGATLPDGGGGGGGVGWGGGLGFSVRIMLFPSRLRLCPLPARAHAIAPLLWPRAKFIFLRLCFLLPPCLPPRPHLLPWPCICESAAPSFRLEFLLSLCCSVQNLQNPSQAS